MPVNPELVGRVFPPTAPYLVGREKVREFARAVFADDPQHLDPAAAQALGYADVVAPPTFAMVVQDQTLQQLLAEPDSGIVLQNVLHAEQRFRYTRPIVAGDELTGTLTVTGVRALGGNAMVTSEAEITDAAGEHVVTATSVLLVGEGDAVIAAVGDIVAERTVQLTRESLVRYAGASGDFNPIHYRDDVAHAVGLPGVLAHGMLTMGLAVETIVPWLGDSGRILDYGVRFTRPVVVDPERARSCTIVAKVGAVDEDTARIDLTVTHGETTVLGKAQVRVRLA